MAHRIAGRRICWHVSVLLRSRGGDEPGTSPVESQMTCRVSSIYFARPAGCTALYERSPLSRGPRSCVESCTACKTSLAALTSFLARPAGLEPATSGLEKLDRPLFADSAALQPSVTVQVGLPRRVHRSQRLARNRSPLVTTLLQAAAKRLRIPKLGDKESTDLGLTGEVYLMSVKEVAKTLRVCTATVYNLVEWGELAHVRVSNAIRVVVQASD